MRLLAGDFEVAAAREIAIDVFFAHDSLDAIDGFERRGVHFAHGFAPVAPDQSRNWQFHACEDHAAVAATGAPAEGFGFENSNNHAAFRESKSCGESAEAAADNSDIDVFRQVARGLRQ